MSEAEGLAASLRSIETSDAGPEIVHAESHQSTPDVDVLKTSSSGRASEQTATAHREPSDENADEPTQSHGDQPYPEKHENDIIPSEGGQGPGDGASLNPNHEVPDGSEKHEGQLASHSDETMMEDLNLPAERAGEEAGKMEEQAVREEPTMTVDLTNQAGESQRADEGLGDQSEVHAQVPSNTDEAMIDELIKPSDGSRGTEEEGGGGAEGVSNGAASAEIEDMRNGAAQEPSHIDEKMIDDLVNPPEASHNAPQEAEELGKAEDGVTGDEGESGSHRRQHVEINLNHTEMYIDERGALDAHKSDIIPNGTSHSAPPNGIVSSHSLPSQSRISKAAKQVDELCMKSPHAAARYNTLSKLRKHIEEQRFNVKDASGFTPLHFAACYGNKEAVGILLQAKALVNEVSQQGWSPLHVASRNGHHGCMVELLEAGSNLTLEDKQGMSALHNASCCVTDQGYQCVVELLKRGANVNQLDADNWTPLHFAARFNNVSTLLKLLEYNADPNRADRDRWTPLHNSARNGRNRCVQELIDHGADLFLTTRYGETALHIACRKGKSKVVEKIMNSIEKLGTGKLTNLLMCQDVEGRTAEDVASSEYIRSLLRRETRRGSSYDFVPELTKSPSFEGTRVKKKKGSAACTIL